MLIVFTKGNAQSGFQKIYVDSDSLAPYMTFRCLEMKTLRDTTYSEYGIQDDFKRVEIYSKIRVQIECNGTTEAKFDTAIARFEIATALNHNDSLRANMIDSIYHEWMGKSEELQDCFTSCSMDNYFLYSNGEYVLFNKPNNNWKNSYISIYFSGLFIKVTFRGFTSKGGWGGLSSFMSELCYFNFGDAFIEPGAKPTIIPKDFFLLYKGGKFNE